MRRLSNILHNYIIQYLTLTGDLFSFIYSAIILTSATQNNSKQAAALLSLSLKLLCAAASAAVVPLLSIEGDAAPPRVSQSSLQLRQVGKNAERQATPGFSAPQFLLLSRRWAVLLPVAEPN